MFGRINGFFRRDGMPGEHKEITECLIEIAQELGGTLTAEEALHVIIEHMKVFFPHQSLAVLIRDENTGTLNIKTSREISYSFVKHFKRSVGGTIDRKSTRLNSS